MDETVRVAFKTLGCKVNQVEAETVAAALLGSGIQVVGERDAQAVVINTCAVTMEAAHKARKAIRHAIRLPSRPVVVVTGCLAALDRGELSALDERVVVETDKEAVAERVARLLGVPEPLDAAVRAGAPFRTRAMVKVQDGCDNRCAYCIVPDARGRPRSVPRKQVLAQISALVDAGVNEVVLTGINIGRYRDGRTDLAALVEDAAVAGVRRIRLSSIEPPDLTEGFLSRVAQIPAFVEHLHVPLQSGCDRTLAAMGRRYAADEYEEVVERAREAIPGLAVTTDVICGFPGETDADAAASEERVRRIGFAKLHVFRFSPRPGTPAAAHPAKVPPRVAALRAERMRAVGEDLRAAFLDSHVGRSVEVLVERVMDGAAEGMSRDGLRVRVEGSALSAGMIVHARVRAREGAWLVAMFEGTSCA